MHRHPTFEPAETLPWAIREWAVRDGDRPFLWDVDGSGRSYGQVHEGALRWASAFAEAGVAPGETVAVMDRTCAAAEERWLGLAWRRAVQTGVNADFRGQALRYVLGNCRARYVICRGEFLTPVRDVAAALPHLETVVVTDLPGSRLPGDFPLRLLSAPDMWDAADPARDLSPPLRHEIACISYTSGTTGVSKGVLVPWGRFWPDHIFMDATETDVFYCPFPVSHISGMLPLAWYGFVGGQVLLRESFKTQSFWDDVRRFGCTATALIPVMMNWLLDQPARADDLDNPLRCVAGAPVVARVEEFKSRFGVTMRTNYGTTEVGVPLYAGPDVSADRASTGKWVTPGFRVRIADADDYDVVPGEAGELLVRTEEPWRMMAGYFEMPDKTGEAWRNGWFHTGDAFVQDEVGRYHFVDRVSDSMRRRGENISSAEVEAYVEAHPAVAETAAIGVPSEQGEEEVKICVLVREGEELRPEELHAFLAEQMPAFMVPRYIELIDDPQRTDAMKRIRKSELRRDPLNSRTWDASSARTATAAAGDHRTVAARDRSADGDPELVEQEQ